MQSKYCAVDQQGQERVAAIDRVAKTSPTLMIEINRRYVNSKRSSSVLLHIRVSVQRMNNSKVGDHSHRQ